MEVAIIEKTTNINCMFSVFVLLIKKITRRDRKLDKKLVGT